MTTESNEQIGPPLQEEDFGALLKEYKVGLKGDYYKTIAKHISHMGGSTVYEEPDVLARVLTDFSQEIDPVKRKLILQRWFSEKNISVPKELLRKVGLSKVEMEQEERAEKGEKEPEKYSVDPDTGAITAASTADRSALTWAEAEKLSKEIKKGIEEREKREAKAEAKVEAKAKAEAQATEGGKESPFIQDDEGNWIINPNARVTGLDVLALEAVRKSQERGEPVDPFEILAKQAGTIQTMRSVFGGGKEGGGLLDSVDDLLKLKTLLGADEDTKSLLAGIYKRLTEEGGVKGESEAVKGLRDELRGLREELERKERERIEERITSLNNALTDVRSELSRARNEARATDEYGIMSEAIKMVDRRLGAFEGTVRGALGRPPALLPPETKEGLTKAISEEAVEEQALDKLATEVFYEH